MVRALARRRTAPHPNAADTWIVAFYLLPLAFNYPLFMATVYRADYIRADFEKYKNFIRTSPCC